MLKCNLERSHTSCKSNDNVTQLTTNDRSNMISLRNENDAENYTMAENTSSLLESTIQSQVLKRFLVIPKPRVLNICALNPDAKEFEVPKAPIHISQTIAVPTFSCRVDINKPKYSRPSFLYEQYPLKPALLYNSPLSYVRDPLNRLDQIASLPQSSLHSITSVLPTGQCAAVHTHYNLPEYIIQKSRLISGEEECRYSEIASAAWKTRKVFSSEEGTSVESVCSTCHRKGFLVPRTTQHIDATSELVGISTTRESNDAATLSEAYNYAPQSIEDSLVSDNEKHMAEKESFLFYNPYYHYEHESGVETPLLQPPLSSDNSRLTMSLNSQKPEYHDLVPIFEVLPTHNFENYSHQPALKHKDSLILYANLKQKRRKTEATLDIGEGKSLRFITFFDEAQLANKSSDENIIFGSARGINYKFQCWEESRIAWLSELERRHEVQRRRQKRAELRKLKQQTAKSHLGQCSFWCRRLRVWLAKWNI